MPLSPIRTIFEIETTAIVPELPAPEDGRRLDDVDLDFTGVDTQYSTHVVHPYVAAMNPPLGALLLRTFVPARGSVLDPYCGGGCIPVEALLGGITCVGSDVNPLAVLVARVKTTRLPLVRIWPHFLRVLQEARHVDADPPSSVDKTALYWFKEYMVAPLARLAAAIGRTPDEPVRRLLEVAFSLTVRSVMLTYRGEVRLRRLTGADLERANPDVLATFQKRAELTIQRVSQLPTTTASEVKIQDYDVRSLPFDDGAFSTIVCSPPYADDKNGVGYFQFSRVMLNWLGYSAAAIREAKDRFLGTDLVQRPAPPSGTLQRALVPIGSVSERLAAEGVAFYADYHAALAEMARVTAGRIVIVIGNRVLGRTLLDNAAITTELMGALGVPLEQYYQRRLRKKRLADLGGDGGGTAIEHILVYRLP